VGNEGNPYAGRWVARLRGRIVAQGGTPEQARRAAQSRFKEIPEIIFMPANYPLNFSPLLDTIRAAMPEGVHIYVVGGAMRDVLLGRQSHDLDFCVEKDAIKMARHIANALKADFYPLDLERDTGRVIFTAADGKRTVLDFASFRGKDLEADLAGRDFTLNAIAYNLLDGSIHDPLGGTLDLKEKRLRTCSATSILDDPVRILRGVRLAVQFGFHLLPETITQMKAAVIRLEKVSAERLRDELFRMLDGAAPAACIRSLDHLGALDKLLPELAVLKGVEQIPPHVHDVWEHTLATCAHLQTLLGALDPAYNPDKAADWHSGLAVLRLGRYRDQIGADLAALLTADRPARALLFLSALYHDSAKPQAKKIDEYGQIRFWEHDQLSAELAAERGHALVLSREENWRFETTVRNHMRVHFFTNRLASEAKEPTRRAIYRFFRECGPAGVDVCLLAMADLRATYEQTLPAETWAACLNVVRMLLEAWYEKPKEQVSPPALVDGTVLMKELSLQPGKQVGRLLEAIREAQAMGEVSTREQALTYAREELSKNNG
jgi:tRNA nucleotidyltransferase/poly(A) polymerase